MSPMLNMIIDGVLALLLVAVIIACSIVYKRLKALKDGQDEMKGLVSDLNQAVIEAQRSVSNMKHTAVEMEGQLQTQIGKAKSLSEELAMITEAGNNLADRIESRLTSGNNKPTQTIEEAAAAQEQKAKKKAVGPEQKELLDALKEAR